jgi:hypothetical protein
MRLTPYDAWVIEWLLYDRQPPLNGEIFEMSECARPLGELIAESLPAKRQGVWDLFSATQPDREEMERALNDVKPTNKPAPSVEHESDWPPLRLDDLPPVEPFPVDVLPDAAAKLVTEGAGAIGCPPDFLGLAILAVAGGVIGRSASLLLKDGYFVSSVLFAGCVGPPGDGKTPALKAAAVPVRLIGERLDKEYKDEYQKWKDACALLGPKTKPPAPPKPRRIDIDDATMEVLPIVWQHNPRGLVMIRDELSAFILGMNQYRSGKGNDRSNFLKIWSGDQIVKDRVSHENNAPIRCPHPVLTIVGGMTPDMLGELADPSGRDDGFIDRFLLVYPDPLPVPDWSNCGIRDDVANDWCMLINNLWKRPLTVNKEGQECPHTVHFTPEGQARWEARYRAHVAEMNAPDFGPNLRGPWSKFREYAGRLTLNVTLMHHAADELADPLAVPKVGPQPVDDAWRLVDYLKGHTRRIRAAIACGPVTGEMRAVKAIVDWIRDKRVLAFTESEITQARRWITPSLESTLKYLTDRHAIRPQQAPRHNAKGGRPPSRSYKVNPALLVTKNPRNP